MLRRLRPLQQGRRARLHGSLQIVVRRRGLDQCAATDLCLLASGASGKRNSSDGSTYVPAGHALPSRPSRRSCGSEARSDKLYTQDALKGFLVPLVQRGTSTERRGRAAASYYVYSCALRFRAVADGNAQVRLPPPAFVVDAERRERARADERRAELEAAGANSSALDPADQLKGGRRASVISAELLGAPLKDGARAARPTARLNTSRCWIGSVAWRAAARAAPRLRTGHRAARPPREELRLFHADDGRRAARAGRALRRRGR